MRKPGDAPQVTDRESRATDTPTMRMTYLEALAAELYTEAAVPQGPPWDQLGDVTRSVWIERARRQMEFVLGTPVSVDIAE